MNEDEVLLGFVAILLLFTMLMVAVLNDRTVLLRDQLHVTRTQVNNLLETAAYRVMAERDSTVRACVRVHGPLDPKCR